MSADVGFHISTLRDVACRAGQLLRAWRKKDPQTPSPTNTARRESGWPISASKLVPVETPSSRRIDLIARRTIVLGCRPAAVRPYVCSSADARQRLVDSDVWDAMCRMLSEKALPYRGS
jgi:hypothetical protein